MRCMRSKHSAHVAHQEEKELYLIIVSEFLSEEEDLPG